MGLSRPAYSAIRVWQTARAWGEEGGSASSVMATVGGGEPGTVVVVVDVEVDGAASAVVGGSAVAERKVVISARCRCAITPKPIARSNAGTSPAMVTRTSRRVRRRGGASS